MRLALDYARRGFGRTFPNPAVGCVLVRNDQDQKIGAGFHPRAGMPHAEIFALLEACGHVPDGVAAAESVLRETSNPVLFQQVSDLSETYTNAGGPEFLFGRGLSDMPVTAYVTLEPCCHHGKTPPCALSLVLAGVNRVVVGLRDPNPRVDGGGVQLLQEAGVTVDLLEGQVAKSCEHIVECFVKRITPRQNDYSQITGAMRAAIRTLAGRLKTDGSLVTHAWPGQESVTEGSDADKLEATMQNFHLDASWMEAIDTSLWRHELVLLKLTKAVKKATGAGKAAKRLGERIASELDAHVAQTVGHTVLLYRPGIPPVLDLVNIEEQQRIQKQRNQQKKEQRGQTEASS
jgi:pyrimidine deaminase RibD-like protein/RNA-binding protein YhbY